MSDFEKEIEIKFPVDKDILEKISSIKLAPYEEIDEYFTTKEMMNNSIFLRLRRKKGKIFLQFKNITVSGKQTNDCYEADELHLELIQEQYGKIKKIFLVIFPHNFILKKIRSKGFFNDCEICLDDVEGLGLFLEIEGPREKILEVCNKLNIDIEKREKGRGYAIMVAKKLGLL